LAESDLKLSVVRLTKRSQFLALRARDHAYVTPFFILQHAPIQELESVLTLDVNECAVGFTATKRLGNAVVRNRIKRRLRALVQQSFPDHAKSGYGYVFIARTGCDRAPYAELVQHATRALKRIHR
jgi:ribonuclease P protein component